MNSRRPATRTRDVPVPEGFDIRPHISGIGAVLAGQANVILQLSRPGVGYGVMQSEVHDGSAMLHPFKRARTTFSYLGVAMLGNEDDRTAYRRDVNGQHAQVVSQPGAEVEYRAMDPDLQLWVAACLYFGTVDVVERLNGPLEDSEADALYAHCARFGTTLQVTPDQWPADRVAFEAYWRDGLERASIDEPVRDYLMRLVRLENFPAIIGRPLRRFSVFVTTGFLPPQVRTQMALPWSDAQEQRLDRFVRRVGAIDRGLPLWARNFPLNVLLRDVRVRRRLGRRLV